MVHPKLHKVALKALLDSTLYRGVIDAPPSSSPRPPGRATSTSTRAWNPRGSSSGQSGSRAPVRPIERPGALRRRLRLDRAVPLLLSLGRVAPGRESTSPSGAFRSSTARISRSWGRTSVELRESWPTSPTARCRRPGSRHGAVARLDAAPRPLRRCRRFRAPFGVRELRDGSQPRLPRGNGARGDGPLRHRRPAPATAQPSSFPTTSRALGSALAHLLGDTELRLRLADEARALATKWSWTRVVELQEDVYRQALERG